jgi:membrane protease YdiL (CAAX protease family)
MNGRIKEWIKQNQVISFLIITFMFSWFFFWLNFVVFNTYRPAMALLGKIAVFGPAISALIVSAIVNPKPKLNSTKWYWIIFIIVWLLAWIIMVLNVMLLYQIPIQIGLVVPFGIAALLPAWIVSSGLSSNPGIRQQFQSLVKPKGTIVWYLFALLFYPVILLVGILISNLAGNQLSFNNMSISNANILPLIMFAEGIFASGGINEESGWRGFLLPRLQNKYSVIIAFLFVWLFWALWHLPLDIFQEIPLSQILLNRIVFNLLATVLLAWAYNRSGGSILVVAIFHVSMNTAGTFIPITLLFLIPLVLFVILIIFKDRMWYKLPIDHPAVYKDVVPLASTEIKG